MMNRFARSVFWFVGTWFLAIESATVPVADAGEPRQIDSPFNISAREERVVKSAAHRSEYDIEMGGSVDMDNSMTRHYERVA